MQPIAAIDIGTNSVHLVIASLDDNDNLAILDSDKEVLRLGELLDQHGNFPQSAIEKTVSTIQNMKDISKSYNPRYRIIATHATRMAHNKNELFRSIYQKTGLHVSAVDGIEEARLVSIGMRYGLPLGQEAVLGLDIGGGSTEIIIFDQKQIYYATSLELGAVTLRKHHLGYDPSNFRPLENEIASKLAPIYNECAKHSFAQAIVCSGSAKALANMQHRDETGENLIDSNGYILKTKNIKQLTKRVKSIANSKEVAKIWHLDLSRAELVLAGSSILSQISKTLNVKEWVVSSYGVREGLVVDTVKRLSHPQINITSPEDIRTKNILKLGERCNIDADQAGRVANLSLNIFDSLNLLSLEGFKVKSNSLLPDRDILFFASWLHECGKFINFTRYHRHSFYLIVNSKLMGFSQKERLQIGLVAQFQRKGKARKKHFEFSEFTEKELKRINLLASILRLAAAANRSRQGNIQSITISDQSEQLKFVVEGSQPQPDNSVDLLRMKREKQALEKNLSRSILIECAKP